MLMDVAHIDLNTSKAVSSTYFISSAASAKEVIAVALDTSAN